MEKALIIFDSYNLAVEESYNKTLSSVPEEDILKIKDETFDKQLQSDILDWESTPQEKLGGVTPAEYFKAIEDMDDVVDLFKLGAKLCDKDIPRVLADKLMSYGQEAITVLLALATDKGLIKCEENNYIPVMAVRTLGNKRATEVVDQLINLILSLDENSEILVEEITDTLINIGIPSIAPILDIIENTSRITYSHEYLLNVVVKLGKTNKSEDIYKCLKNAFLKMDDKLLGALCLGDYGDGRAIPALRGYLEKNRGAIDKQTYMEIKASIKRLGGSIDDL